MKLYIANGSYYGTQADAKKIDKAFELVEVPTDKERLIAYLDELGLPFLLHERIDGERTTIDVATLRSILEADTGDDDTA